MALLGFDTATEDTAVCLLEGGDVVHESLIGVALDGSPGHTTALLDEVEAAVGLGGGWDVVERIAVGVGPGSFTGLRVGIATAKGLAASRGIEAVGICTLDAIARGLGDAAGEVAGESAGGGGRARLAVLDARRGEVFAALYSSSGLRQWDPWVGAPEALAERLSELADAPLAAGSGAVRFRHELAGADVLDDADPVHRVAGRHVCDLASEGAGVEPLAPIYLRPPDAERWRERDTADRSK